VTMLLNAFAWCLLFIVVKEIILTYKTVIYMYKIMYI